MNENYRPVDVIETLAALPKPARTLLGATLSAVASYVIVLALISLTGTWSNRVNPTVESAVEIALLGLISLLALGLRQPRVAPLALAALFLAYEAQHLARYIGKVNPSSVWPEIVFVLGLLTLNMYLFWRYVKAVRLWPKTKPSSLDSR